MRSVVTRCCWLMLAAMPSALAAALPAPTQPADTPDSIEVTPSSLELRAGETAQLTALVKDASGNVLPNAPVIFFSTGRSSVTVTRRCCTARSKSLTSLCRLQSHPAQYVSGIPSAAILLSISHPIRCSTRCLANVRARISGPMIAL